MAASPDSSCRFILPADSPYLKNLSVLWSKNMPLARWVESLDGPGMAALSKMSVEASKSGPPTLTVAAGEGRTFQLHSRYDPVAEGQKLAQNVKAESAVAYYVLGLGLGYHLEALFAKVSREAVIFVFEADPQMVRTALEHRDLSAMLASGRVHFVTSADKSELFGQLTPHAAMCTMGFEGLVHPPSLALHKRFYEQVQHLLTEFAAFARTCMSTLVINGRRTAENITRNIARYTSSNDVATLEKRYRGFPAIVVSAGPSLRRNKHLLHDANGRAVIIAVQTILQPLLEMGIEPQFATSLDYHDISARYYEKLPAGLRTHLVAEPKASPVVFDMFPGPISILGNDFADRLLREDGAAPQRGRLPSGATVAHLAYYLAEHLGCDPIIFVGQDLGFSDGLAYAPGTNHDEAWRSETNRFCTVEMRQWEFIARERHILRKIPDQQGRPMYTEERLYTYLQQFERDFLKTRTKVIDATEGGARKRGATVMTLAEAIGQYCKGPLPQVSVDARPALRWTQASQCMASLRSRAEESRQIERITRETQPLLEEIRDHLTEQSRVNQAISRIDQLRAQMDALGPTYDLVIQLTQRTELERFQRDRRIAAENLSGKELQRRQIERDIENVKAVADAAREFVRLADEVIAKLGTLTDPQHTRQEAA